MSLATPAALAGPLDPAAWILSGSSSADPGGELHLVDDPGYASAYQIVDSPGELYRLSFELRAELSAETPSDPFGFQDLFAVTAYAVDDPEAFDLSAGGPEAFEILQLDAFAPLRLAGELGPGARGEGWQSVSATFASPAAFVAVAFELFELAVIPGDSQVRIADADLSEVGDAVPEPRGLLLLAFAAGAAALRLRS